MHKPWGQNEIGVFKEQRKPVWLKQTRTRGQKTRSEGAWGSIRLGLVVTVSLYWP